MDSDAALQRPDPLRSLRLIAWAALACLPLAACMDAETLGAAPASRVVISGTPTWSSGIGELLNLKCAVCHQVPRLPSSPDNVPPDLDLRFEKTYGAIRAAEDIAAQISLGTLRHEIVYDDGTYSRPVKVTIRTMPLPFATPLYTDEITALETWAGNVLAAQSAYTSPALSGANPMTAADGELLYKRYCQACHGADGSGPPVQWPLRGYTAGGGPAFARAILSTNPKLPMNSWPVLVQLANLCTPVGTPTTCNGTQLDAIATYLAQF